MIQNQNTCSTPCDLYLTAADFGEGNTYVNPVMKNMRFRVYEDCSMILVDGRDWLYEDRGGFRIIKTGYVVNEDSRFIVQFY